MRVCENENDGGRTTATLVRTERASQVRVTGGICVNQASKPTTGMVVLSLQLRACVLERDMRLLLLSWSGREREREQGFDGPVTGYTGPEINRRYCRIAFSTIGLDTYVSHFISQTRFLKIRHIHRNCLFLPKSALELPEGTLTSDEFPSWW